MEKGPQLTTVGALLLCALALWTQAADARLTNPPSSYYVSVPVIDATPVRTTRTVEHPVRHCTSSAYRSDRHYHDPEHRRYQHHEPSYFMQSLFGGLVGGLIGNQFGGGNGKKAMTAIGALAGSSIARDAARRQHAAEPPSRVCHTTYESEVVEDISGWDVTYEYGGQQFTKRMSERPGDSLRVRVQLSPEFDHE